MKIAGGLKKGELFIDADLCVTMEDGTEISNKDEIIADMKDLSEQYGAISCNYNEETDTIEVRFAHILKVFNFFESLRS